MISAILTAIRPRFLFAIAPDSRSRERKKADFRAKTAIGLRCRTHLLNSRLSNLAQLDLEPKAGIVLESGAAQIAKPCR